MYNRAVRISSVLATLLTVAVLPRPATAVIQIEDTSVFGTLSIPAGETGQLRGVVTLEGGTIDVLGSLLSYSGQITLTGSGQVIIHQPTGGWNYTTLVDTLLIDSGVEVLGERGTSFATEGTVNRGTFAAIPGGNSSAGFRILVGHGFTNEGVLEAREGGMLWLDTLFGDEDFNTTGTIRALPGGLVRFSGHSISSLATFGTVDNQGTIELDGILDNTGNTTDFAGGDWVLISGARITGGSVTSSSGGRLAVRPYRFGAFISDEPVELEGVTLATDLFAEQSSRINVKGLTLNSAIRFTGSSELLLDSTGPITGNGTIQTDGGSGTLRAAGGTVTLPDGISLRAVNNTLSLRQATGDPLGAFDLSGPVEIESGNISIDAPTASRGSIVVRNGGRLTKGVTHMLSNFGTLEIQAGSVLDLGGAIQNEGTIDVDQAAIIMRGGTISGPGALSVTDSTILSGTNMTLSQFLAIDGTRVDRAVYAGTLDLQGSAINIGTAPGERWTLSGGALTGGAVNSSSGAELLVAQIPGGFPGNARGTIFNLELNTDLRVPAGALLAVTGPLTGTGELVVDGGRLEFGNRTLPLPSELVDRIAPVSGEVVFVGPVDNVGRTLRLRSGVDWSIEHTRSDVFIGGRVEGDPGVILRVTEGYGVEPWFTIRQGVTLALPTIIENTNMYVREGLNLDDATITIGQPNGSQFSHGRLVFVGPQTLGGEGEVRFNRIDGFPSHPQFPRINMIEIARDPMQAAGLTIAPGITVRTSEGSGYIGGRYFHQLPPEAVPLTNEGLLLAENGHTLSLFVSDFAQRGTLRAAADSTLVVNDSVGANDGLVHLDGGTIELVGQSFENSPDGEITGHGMLDVSQTSFTNAGLIAPQGGALNILGDFTQSADGMLHLDVTSDPGGNSETLAVNGSAALAGRVELNHFGAAVPMLGKTWTLVTATDGIAGGLLPVAPWLPANMAIQIQNSMNALTATLVERIAGDFNSDGRVDAADYVVWRKTDGSPGGYSDWRTNFDPVAAPPGGSGANAGSPSSAVPEPATATTLIALLATLALISGRAHR